jgi:serine/threonine protein kinase
MNGAPIAFDVTYLMHSKVRWDGQSVTYHASLLKGLHPRKPNICIRKMYNVLTSPESATSRLEELRILQHLKGVPTILYIDRLLLPLSCGRYSHLLVVEERTVSSLSEIIRLGLLPDDSTVCTWAWQLLDAVKHVHAVSIVHGAIHPRHVLLTAEGNVKVSVKHVIYPLQLLLLLFCIGIVVALIESLGGINSS